MILSILSITLIAILAVHLDNSSLSGMVSRPDLIRLPQRQPMPVLQPTLPRQDYSQVIKDKAIPNIEYQVPIDSSPACPNGCLWGGKGISVKMYNGVIITPKSNFLFADCDAPKDQCYADGDTIHVKFKEHPYYKDPAIYWSMSGLKCEDHVWVPQEGFLMGCPPKPA